MNKKGVSGKMISIIISLILGVLLLLAYGGPALSKIKLGIEGIGAEAKAYSEDCDSDGVFNKLDKCPCISTKGEGHTSTAFLGCPKTLTDPNEAENDRKTCLQYPSEKNPGTFVEKCDAKKKEDCDVKYKTKCQEAKETLAPVQAKPEGIEVESDLAVLDANLQAEGASKGLEKYFFDFNGKVFQWIEVAPTIKNKGPKAISHSFTTTVSVCDILQKNCVKKKLYEIDPSDVSSSDLENIWKDPSAFIDLSKFKINIEYTTGLGIDEEITPKVYLQLGSEADLCDNPGHSECYLKIHVDSTEKLAEPQEDNNEYFILLDVVNQGTFESFQKFQIEAVYDDGTDGGSIDWECEIFAKSGKGSFEECVQDRSKKYKYYGVSGSLPQTVAAEGQCWIFVAQHEGTGGGRSDIGAGAFKQGEVIDYRTEKQLTPTFTFADSDADALEVFTNEDYKWKAKTSGSLICKENFWHRCDVANDLAPLVIDNKRYVCKNREWS